MDFKTRRPSQASRAESARLDVDLPEHSLFSSIVTSSPYFNPTPPPAVRRENFNLWISDDDEDDSRPVSISALSNYSKFARGSRRAASARSARTSFLGPNLRHDEIRPHSIALSESTEKLGDFPSTKSVKADAASQLSVHGDGIEYPKGLKLVLITIALCLAVFVMALDNSIIATAIPKITDEFHSLPDVGWYGSSYMLTCSSLQLFMGRVYTFWTIKWTFLAVVAIFELGSLICAVAKSSIVLIVGRAIAGIGSAGIFAGALTILAYSVPLHRRPFYTGLVSGMWGISSVAGPLLGGVFTDQVSWRWCFYINLPIGAVTIGVIGLFFPDPQRDIQPAPWRVLFWRLDPLGTSIFLPAIICLLLALQWGGITYAWDSSRITSLIMLAVFLLSIFVYMQRRMGDNATVPPRILKQRTVWASGLFAFNTGSCFLASMYFLPIWFQAVQGASPISSGVKNLPMLLAIVLCAVGSGAAVSFWGYYTPFMILGSVFMAVGYGLITTFDLDTSTGAWVGYQLLAGLGVGLALQQPIIAVQVVCDMADIPTGTAMIVFMQTLGGALMVSASQTVFTNKLVDKVVEYVPGLDPEIVIATGATNIRDSIKPEWVHGVILAYNDALTTSFYVSAATAAATILGAVFVEWKSVKGKNIEAAMG